MKTMQMFIDLADTTIEKLWQAGYHCDEPNSGFAFDRATHELNIDTSKWNQADWDLYNVIEAQRIMLAKQNSNDSDY
jgi:hypothetical protein